MDIRIVDVEWALDDAGATYQAYVVEVAPRLGLQAAVELKSLARRACPCARRWCTCLGFRKSFENCQTQRLMHRCGLGPWKIIDQLLVLLYASRGRTRSCPRVLEALSRRVAAAWTDAHSRRQVGELLSKASTLCAPVRARLRPHAWDCSASGTSRRAPACGGQPRPPAPKTISTEGQP